MIPVERVLGCGGVAVLRLSHDLLRLALHALDLLERAGCVALGRHLDIDYGAVRVSGGERPLAALVVLGKIDLKIFENMKLYWDKF